MKKLNLFFVVMAVLVFIVWSVNTKRSTVVKEEPEAPVKETISIVSQESSKGTKPSPKLIEAELSEQFDDYLKDLPTNDDLQNLTEEEVHHTPEIIKQGGEVIGRIHEEAQREPVKRVGAMVFFKKCAEDEQLAISIRAVCLHKIYKLIPEWEIPVPLAESNIPQEVLDLALKL